MSVGYLSLMVLALFLTQHVYAHDSVGQPGSRELSGSLQTSCPAADFSVFISAFSNDVSVQKAFTRSPLKIQRLDPDAGPEAKKVIQDLGRHQIHFPILPLQEERAKRLLEIRFDSITTSQAKITLSNPDTNYQVAYEFEIQDNSCWNLLSVDDQSPSGGKVVHTNWLDGVFPSMTNCTPGNFYFNKKDKKSNNGLLEKNGYRTYELDEYTAKYKIREKFFNFDAIEIAIPSGTDSIYTVTVQASAMSLGDAIKIKTDYRPPIYNKKFKARSANAYLIPEEKNKSTFVCFTFDGGF